ncbi:MAG: DUF1820 family protein [Acidiferrobacteraceae bacterium]|nr:DUF1820 family protein [Acidiferrobacteraceae bacterium]
MQRCCFCSHFEGLKVIVDPSDEKLKSEFAGVKRTYIPLHAIVHIDKVKKKARQKSIRLAS